MCMSSYMLDGFYTCIFDTHCTELVWALPHVYTYLKAFVPIKKHDEILNTSGYFIRLQWDQ